MLKTKYSYVKCRTALSKSKLPGLDYSLNPYFGCEHGCIYCYSRSVFQNEDVALNWGGFVKAKENVVEVLSRELTRKPRGIVGVSTVTDPYQPLESKLYLTRKCLQMLSSRGFPVSIQTKSNLILRDVDIIKPVNFDVEVTITTMDYDLAKKLEPKASSPDARAQVVEEFAAKKVETRIFLGPIIPGFNDSEESVRKVVEVAKKTGSKLIYDKLNLRRWVLESITPFMEKEKPELVKELPILLNFRSEYWRRVASMVEAVCSEKAVYCEPAF
jgi:DNA repair photolyase